MELSFVLDVLLSLCLPLFLSLGILFGSLHQFGVVYFKQAIVGNELSVSECFAELVFWVRLLRFLIFLLGFLSRNYPCWHIQNTISLIILFVFLVILLVLSLGQDCEHIVLWQFLRLSTLFFIFVKIMFLEEYHLEP